MCLWCQELLTYVQDGHRSHGTCLAGWEPCPCHPAMFPVLVFGSLALLIQEPSCPQPPYELSAFEVHLPQQVLTGKPPFPMVLPFLGN